jgi:hypothetical protein
VTKKRFCTICGKRCPLTAYGSPRWARHVYGVFTEPRCSQKCAEEMVVDVEAQQRLERMGTIILGARMEEVIRRG